MSLIIVTSPDGTRSVVHDAPPATAKYTPVPVPSYNDTLAALQVLRDTSTNSYAIPALDVIERFIRTR